MKIIYAEKSFGFALPRFINKEQIYVNKSNNRATSIRLQI